MTTDASTAKSQLLAGVMITPQSGSGNMRQSQAPLGSMLQLVGAERETRLCIQVTAC